MSWALSISVLFIYPMHSKNGAQYLSINFLLTLFEAAVLELL